MSALIVRSVWSTDVARAAVTLRERCGISLTAARGVVVGPMREHDGWRRVLGDDDALALGAALESAGCRVEIEP